MTNQNNLRNELNEDMQDNVTEALERAVEQRFEQVAETMRQMHERRLEAIEIARQRAERAEIEQRDGPIFGPRNRAPWE